MKTWKKILVTIIALFLVLILPVAVLWTSLSSSILNADTYKPLVPLAIDTLQKQGLTSNGIQIEINDEIKNMLTNQFSNWIDSVFDYVNGKTNELNLDLPDDSELKPALKTILLQTAKENDPSINQLNDEQIDSMFEQQYPTMKNELQLQLDSLELELESNINSFRDPIKLANTFGNFTIIISIILIIIGSLIIFQLRSIFNWIGTCLLISCIPLLIIGIVALIGTQSILYSANVPIESLASIQTVMINAFSTLTIYSGILVTLGIILLFVKFALPKEIKQEQKASKK